MDQNGDNIRRILDVVKGVDQARPIISDDGTKLIFNKDYMDDSRIEIHVLDLAAESF